MGWFNNLIDKKVEEKLNESQHLIAMAEGTNISTRENQVAYRQQYESIEIVNRGVNMIVDDVAECRVAVGESLNIDSPRKGVRKATIEKLLNSQPNPFQDINTFKRNLIIDFIIDGNIFIYFDGAHLYHLPAENVTITPDPDTYVNHYMYNGQIKYSPSEIIHVKENSFYSIFRGISRLRPANRTMKLLTNMRTFQDNFFKNGAVPGLVIKSPNTLSEKIKTRMLASWQLRYNPTGGGKRPLILDGGMEIDAIANINFKELDFQESISSNEKTILKALGVPPVLLDGGNNANIRPNHRLYYLETVLPIVRKLNFALERFFGFKLNEDVADIPALQPELSELASYHSTLVNGGIITPNEARVALGKEPIEGHDDVRIPANVAGSAVNPDEGGRPEGSKE
jgi:HK97 family phage portal protein